LALAEAGCELRYHGDLDWPGVSIAATVLRLPGARPWRLGASDHREALHRLDEESRHDIERPLTGAPVSTPWDPGLAAAMEQHRRVVYEEDVLDLLLADLGAAPAND
jgi:uncharacterized protein (TIGR02679 family)